MMAKKDTTTVLELWHPPDHLYHRMVVDPKRHGKIMNDPTGFGCPTWSADETLLLYSAERRSPETCSFWDTTISNNDQDNDYHNDDDDNEKDAARHPNNRKMDSKERPTSQTIRGGQYVLGQGVMEEWGEKLTKQSALMDLYVIHVGTFQVERIANVPGSVGGSSSHQQSTLKGMTLGQAIFSDPSAQSVVYTGWDAGDLGTMPRRLGFIYCRNRPSKIYQSSIEKLVQRLSSPAARTPTGGTSSSKTDTSDNKDLDPAAEQDDPFVCLTPDFVLARYPQYQMIDGIPQIVMLANREGFHSHEGCLGLYRWNGNERPVEEVLPVVDVPRTTGASVAGMGFPGLFVMQPLERNNGLDPYIMLSTIWGSMLKLIRVDLRTNSLVYVHVQTKSQDHSETPDSTLHSHSILCTSTSGDLFISETACNLPARIVRIPKEELMQEADEDDRIVAHGQLLYEFSPLAATAYSSVTSKPVSVDVDLFTIKSPANTDDETETPIQSLLMLPKQTETAIKKKLPLIVIPHGGPHSVSLSTYLPGSAFLCSGGYALLFPNYRGTIGFGQESITSLLTQIGTMDVQDVVAATKHVLDQFGSDTVDASRVGICGGSHGGFLTGHCTGQFPDIFRAAVMRNPVTNIASMVTATDIPDWCYAEVLGSYNPREFRGPTKEEIAIMWKKSPIAYANNVAAPTLIALGMADLRVPPSQGLEWYHSLRSRNIPTKLLQYPEDSHALDSVTTEADHWIHIKQWFDEHL